MTEESEFRQEDHAEASSAPGLPVDLRAIALGFWSWRWPLALGLVLSAAIGAGTAKLFAERSFRAETVMLYQPPLEDTPEAAGMPSLMTLLNMVKIPSNLESVSQQLSLGVDARVLGGATHVEVQPNTTLVTIRATWDSPGMTADIANALRQTFLDNQTRLRRSDAESRVRDLQTRLAAVRTELEEADDRLREFSKQNRVVHLSHEARSLLEELASVNLLLEQARTQERTVEIQVASADRIVEELEAQARREARERAALSDALSETNIRIQRLRESIADDREARIAEALLEEATLAYERAMQGHREGIIPTSELEEARARFKAIEARAVDTPEIQAWREEIAELDKRVIPSESVDMGFTGNLLQGIMLRSFELKLEQTSTRERVSSIEQAKERVEQRLDRLPDIERTHAQLSRAVDVLDAEQRNLEVRLGEARRLLEASALPFTLVAEAKPPPRSLRSNARKIAAGVTLLLSALTLGLVGAAVVLDPRIRTHRELELTLKQVPVLGEIARTAGGSEDPSRVVSSEDFRVAARHLRALLREPGARVLVSAAGHREGVSTAVLRLGDVLGRWEERVLVVECRPRRSAAVAPKKGAGKRRFLPTSLAPFLRQGVEPLPGGGESAVRSAIARVGEPGPDLGTLLQEHARALDEAVEQSELRNVWILPSPVEGLPSDALGTPRFRSLLSQAAKDYSIVLVDAPPVLESVDAENISLAVDGVLLVTAAMGPFRTAIREAVLRFERVEVPVVGAILVGTVPPYSRNAAG